MGWMPGLGDYYVGTPTDTETTETNRIEELFSGLNETIEKVTNIVSMEPSEIEGLYNTVKSISEALLPIAYTLATIFVVITIINRGALFKLNHYEAVLKLLLMFVIGKLVIDNSFVFLGYAYDIVADTIRIVADTRFDSIPTTDGTLFERLEQAYDEMNWIEQMMMEVQLMPYSFIMWVIKTGITVIAYGRIIEIYVYTAIAPLALSATVSEDYSHIAKKFIQGYVGVCLQGFIMLLACKLHASLVIELIDPSSSSGMMDGIGGIMLSGVVLLFVLVKSGSWAKQITGAM